MTTKLNLDDREPAAHDRRLTRRRKEDPSEKNLFVEIVKLAFPILLAAGIAYLTAQGQIETRIAVVEAKEQAHWEEIQRTLLRLDAWITRQEDAQRRPTK